MPNPNQPSGAEMPQQELITMPEHLLPAAVRSDEIPQGSQNADPSDMLHGGYTGVRVGEMANTIARLQAEGKWDQAKALTARLDAVAPPSPSTDEKPNN